MSVLVSIVIPVYKNNTIISETIESCLNQTIKEYEILLVNNNASAETLAAVNFFATQFPGKIRVISESCQGACSARNRGIIESKGEYVALLDDDDMMYPRHWALQVSAEKYQGSSRFTDSMIRYLMTRIVVTRLHDAPNLATMFEPGSLLLLTDGASFPSCSSEGLLVSFLEFQFKRF
jgi:glycosyltransferase involved in cell wall biosynthesis